MKLSSILYLLIILFITAAGGYAKPAAVFDATSHDFGTIQTNSSAKHSFKFKNTGNTVLIIDRIKAG